MKEDERLAQRLERPTATSDEARRRAHVIGLAAIAIGCAAGGLLVLLAIIR